MYDTNFLISDFCISNAPIPKDVADKILLHHLIPLNQVQDCTPFDVFVSYSVKGEPSCWRPYVWEKSRGRSGNSQHTFGERKNEILKNEKGACDITCEDFKINKNALLEALIENTKYIRFAMYDTFIHADYKDTQNGKRLLFSSTINSEWTFKRFI